MTDADAWGRWKEQTFGSGYMIWHDGLDLDAVTRLRGDDRAQALAMLRLGLRQGDTHAAQALAAMGEPADLAALRRELACVRGSERVRLAGALHAAHPDPALARLLVEDLRTADSAGRIDAAIGLRAFADADSLAALLAAVADGEYLVRYHACESLLRRGRVKPPDIARHPAIFERIREDPKQGDEAAARARYDEAAGLLRGLLEP